MQNQDSEWVTEDFHVGDWLLQSGETLRDARLRYHRIGRLNAPKDNLIILPTYYGGAAKGNHPWVGPDSPLDPEQYCIVVPALLGAGESSSPSNTQGHQGGAGFPTVSLYDNVQMQKHLVDQRFGAAAPALVMGWSMGGMQALQWGCLYPDRVKAVLAICATARCHPHNRVFLEGVKAALTCDQSFADGGYQTLPSRGLKAFARVYLGWAYSQAFFRRALYQPLGFETLDDLIAFWEQDHLAQDANDLLTVLHTWQQGDLSNNPVFEGDYPKALSQLTMPTLLMPGSTDLYFTQTDAEADAALMPGARCQPLISDYGHIAGGPGRDPASHREILAAARALLARRAPS